MKVICKKVLVIDDSETDRYVANRMLQKFQFAEEVITKDSGPKALEYLRSLGNNKEILPQFIFLDIRMPEMDGFEFLDEYANLPEEIKSNCIILMLSTSLDPNDLDRAEKSAYVNRFINKPLNNERMEMLGKLFSEM